MKIQENKVAAIEYELKDAQGTTLDKSSEDSPLVYLHGHNNIVPGLEKELEGKTEGDSFSTVIAPEDAYGESDPSRVIELPRTQFEGVETIEPGMTFEAQTPEGVTLLQVVEVKDEAVIVDANHPLAGQELHFDIKVANVRDASEEELAHGHAHGDGGVHH